MTENRKPNCFCEECNKSIYRRPKEILNRSVFCSTICAQKRNKKAGEPCPICGTEVPRKKRAKTCSRSCANKHREGIKYKTGRRKDKAETIKALKRQLVEERGGQCNRCTFNIIDILEVHHILERRNGGTNDKENLELLCPNCHALHHYAKSKELRLDKSIGDENGLENRRMLTAS